MLKEQYAAVLPMDSSRRIFTLFPYASTLPEEDRDNFIVQGIDLGETQAQKVMERHAGLSPSEIASVYGIPVLHYDESLNEKYVQFASYLAKKKEIHLNKNAIQLLQSLIDEEDGNVEEIFIAHELFHYYEMTEIGLVSKRFHINRKFLGGLVTIRQSLLPVREVAANAFCKKLSGISFEPTVLERIYFDHAAAHISAITPQGSKKRKSLFHF